MMQNYLKRAVSDAIEKSYQDVDQAGVFIEPSDNFGDFATNAAMALAKRVEQSPRDVASTLVKSLENNKLEDVDKIEIAGPGFINFYLSAKVFTDNVDAIVRAGHGFGIHKYLEGRKIIVEYTDPNPFKELHIGHIVPNALGESIARLCDISGAKVRRANYQGDVGMHVAKALWGMQHGDDRPTDNASIKERATYLGSAYAKGSTAVEEDEDSKKEIASINAAIYAHSDDMLNELYSSGRKWSLEYFETVYKILGTAFDIYYFESETGPIGKALVEKGLQDGIFKKSDGAIIFPGGEEGLHDRVFINSEGLPTYEAKELGLAKRKHDDFSCDESYVIAGAEITEYFKVLLAAMKKILPECAARTTHIPNGMLKLKHGKMSSRTGDVITAQDFIKDVSDLVRLKMEETQTPLDGIEKDMVVQGIAVGAIKFSVLRQSAGRDIIFDEKESISFQGDSGPYIQYTHARAASILRKAHEGGMVGSVDKVPEEITDVEKLLLRFPMIIEKATKEHAPHHVCIYLLELASAFNSYYANYPILKGGEDAPYRLVLTKAVSQVLRSGLYVLGINAPDRM